MIKLYCDICKTESDELIDYVDRPYGVNVSLDQACYDKVVDDIEKIKVAHDKKLKNYFKDSSLVEQQDDNHTHKFSVAFISKDKNGTTPVEICNGCKETREYVGTVEQKRASNMGGEFSTNWRP